MHTKTLHALCLRYNEIKALYPALKLKPEVEILADILKYLNHALDTLEIE